MQTSQQISLSQIQEVAEAVFEQGPVIVRQAYSDCDSATKAFEDVEALLNELRYKPEAENVFRQFTLYYPESKGHTYERRITLIPKSCNGHTFRFCQEGWGLIQLKCDFREHPMVGCSISVNSAIRAEKWSDTYPDLQSPDKWDWAVVNRKAGRLIRLLQRLGR